MMEQWVLGKWVIGLADFAKVALATTAELAKPLLIGKSRNDMLPLKTNISVFHHSGTRQKPKPQKSLYIQSVVEIPRRSIIFVKSGQ